jgi:hypothetical protein
MTREELLRRLLAAGHTQRAWADLCRAYGVMLRAVADARASAPVNA